MIAKDYIYKILSTSETFGRIILHTGIIFAANDQYYVIHKTFDGVEIITLSQYLENRTEINCTKYKLKQDIDITHIYQTCKDDKFNFINNNCENFVNNFINTYTTSSVKRTSQQVEIWCCIIMTIIIIGIISICKKHK